MSVSTISTPSQTMESRKAPSIITPIVFWIVIAIGILLRIGQFLYNRSLTEGEAGLALNIVHRSYAELRLTLDYVQAAPLGFLMLQKWLTTLFGISEYALRLLPLIAGIASIVLFYEVATRTLRRFAALVALILIVVSDHLIYFSSEVKQYSTDTTIALILTMLALMTLSNGFKRTHLLIFGCASALAFWFSHPAIFVCAGTMLVLLIALLRKKDWHALWWFCVVCVLVLVSLVVVYTISLEPLLRNKEIVGTWTGRFESFPQTSFDIVWLVYVFARSFKFPLGLAGYQVPFGIIFFLIGCRSLYGRNRNITLILLLPVFITLIAAWFHTYPFEGRLLLFITPCLALITAEGLDWVQRTTARAVPLLGTVLTVVLLSVPVYRAGYHIFKPRAPEELRPVMEYIRGQYKQGDMLYVYYASSNAFTYYKERLNFAPQYVIGAESRSQWINYYREITQLRGTARVWFVFSHIDTWHGVNEEELFVRHLEIVGTQKDVFRASGASGYLFDLSD